MTAASPPITTTRAHQPQARLTPLRTPHRPSARSARSSRMSISFSAQLPSDLLRSERSEVPRSFPSRSANVHARGPRALQSSPSWKVVLNASSFRQTSAEAAKAANKDVLKDNLYLTEQWDPEALKYILLPFGTKKTCWDLFTLSFVIYTAIVLPLSLSFFPTNYQVPIGMTVIELIMDVVFVVDIILNFFTAYVNTEQCLLVINRRKIAQNYLRNWFAIDVSGSLPMDFIFFMIDVANGSVNVAGGSGGDTANLALIKILKIPKMLRLGRLFRFLSRFEGAANLGRIFVLLFANIVLIHWIAAAFFPIANRDGKWLELQGYKSDDWFTNYCFCYYACMMMIMGDNTAPSDELEVLFMWAVVMTGGLVNATIFAQVASLVAQMNALSNDHQRKMDRVVMAMNTLKIPDTTQARVRSYFEYVWVRHKDHAGDQFIKDLPTQLRARVSYVVHEPLVRSYPLFATITRKIVSALASKLTPEVYLPREYILVAGHVSRAMYFVSRGRVAIACRSEAAARAMARKSDLEAEDLSVELTDARSAANFQLLERDDYFGEFGLFNDAISSEMSVRAITHCDLYVLRRDDFDSVLRDFPEPAQTIIKEAEAMLDPQLAEVVKKHVQTASNTRDEDGFTWGKLQIKRGGVVETAQAPSKFKFAKQLVRVGLAAKIRKLAAKERRGSSARHTAVRSFDEEAADGALRMVQPLQTLPPDAAASLLEGVDRLQRQLEMVVSRQEKLLAASETKMITMQRDMVRRVERRLEQFLQQQASLADALQQRAVEPVPEITLEATAGHAPAGAPSCRSSVSARDSK